MEESTRYRPLFGDDKTMGQCPIAQLPLCNSLNRAIITYCTKAMLKIPQNANSMSACKVVIQKGVVDVISVYFETGACCEVAITES